MREPDYRQFQKVLERKRPDRPTLFEFFLNGPLYTRLTGIPIPKDEVWPVLKWKSFCAKAYAAAGYDYLTIHASDFSFPSGHKDRTVSVSQNQNAVIVDRESLGRYKWPDPAAADHARLARSAEYLPVGMKLVVMGPGGVLENVIELCGYENLAMMILDNPSLAHEIFEAVGLRLVKYYQLAATYENVMAMISNDDWGFAQQTMFSPEDMRRFVFPWHRKIVQTIHAAGVPAILHSCGNLEAVMDEIIDDLKYDAKHSYEDKITPVEEAYARWGSRIAILGGIDVDFVCRSTPERIQDRCRRMLEMSESRGGYALGTGNSVPEYVPQDNYLAMVRAANLEARFVD